MKPLLTRLLLALILGYTFSNSKIEAQSEYPISDSTFNTLGFRIINHILFFIPQIQTIQPDGKILVCGYGKKQENDFLMSSCIVLTPTAR